MLRLEDCLQVRDLHQQGLSVSQIARTLEMDRKTVRKYLHDTPHPYRRQQPRPRKIDPYRAYLRERWEQGVHNGYKLFREIRQRGYAGGTTQVGALVTSWRQEEQERAFVRFETTPGEQSQIDWAHLGNWQGRRLYCFALTLGYSRLRYIEFTHSQDIEHLLACLIHAFHYCGGVTAVVLADNMKTVIRDRVDGQPQWNPKFLDFAGYYGFVPRVCRPYRPQTKGKIESTVRLVKIDFWPGLTVCPLAELNQQAWHWLAEVNHRVHATTRAIPYERLPHEPLRAIAGQPDDDTSYSSHRLVSKDCLLSYGGSRYSVPHAYAGKSVVVKQPLTGEQMLVCHQEKVIATHRLATQKGQLVSDPGHYEGLPRRSFAPPAAPSATAPVLTPGPGVGRNHIAPEVTERPPAEYECYCAPQEDGHVPAV